MKYVDELFSECKFPVLESPYKESLEEAVRFILKKFTVQGIIVSGSVIQGKHHKNSDLDIYVINNRYECQRIQKFFNSVPTEIFINPVNRIKKYLDDESISGKPSTASMFVTGFTILDQTQSVFKIRSKSKEILTRSPSTSNFVLQKLCYGVADNYENAIDMIGHDDTTAVMLMTGAVKSALEYYFRKNGKWLPRHKDLFIELEKLDADLASLGKDFYVNPDIQQKFKIAEQIMNLTIKVHGFFEWNSDIEIHKED